MLMLPLLVRIASPLSFKEDLTLMVPEKKSLKGWLYSALMMAKLIDPFLTTRFAVSYRYGYCMYLEKSILPKIMISSVRTLDQNGRHIRVVFYAKPNVEAKFAYVSSRYVSG
jgi:hypothetical protein